MIVALFLDFGSIKLLKIILFSTPRTEPLFLFCWCITYCPPFLAKNTLEVMKDFGGFHMYTLSTNKNKANFEDDQVYLTHPF